MECDTDEHILSEQGLLTSEDDYQTIAETRYADSKLPENIDKTRYRNILPCMLSSYNPFYPCLPNKIIMFTNKTSVVKTT